MNNIPDLVYLYTSDRPPQDPTPFYQEYIQNRLPTNRFALTAETDGMINLLIQLADKNYVGRVNIFVDSKKGLGTLRLHDKVIFHVLPNINFVYEILKPGDIFFVRGGFKPWLPLIKRVQDRRQNWILFYRANTSNSRWPFWDVHMDDLVEEPRIAKGKNHTMFVFPFSKPVNEDVFHPQYFTPKSYDVCVGASHIHKKKGQYKTIQALLGSNLRAILPGGMIHCSMNSTILQLEDKIILTRTGAVPRDELAQIMCGSRVFVHSGVGGQNDRGVLEAMACGTKCIITSPERFSPFVSRWPNIVARSQDIKDIYDAIYTGLFREPDCDAHITEIALDYRKKNGVKEVAIPKMKLLLNYISQYPQPGSGPWMTSKDFTKVDGLDKENP